MGVGSYTIPMGEYYSKSKDLQGKVKTVAESVNNNYLKKVSDNITELDSRDQSYLEGCSAYTKAKSLHTKLTGKHEKNLTNMSNFNGQNPLYKVANTDKEFASKFNGIANGTNSSDVTAKLTVLNQSIDDKLLEKKVLDFLKGVSGKIGNDPEIQRIMQLAKTNQSKALEKLLNNDKFLKAIQKDSGMEKLFLSFMSGLENVANTSSKLMTNIVNSISNNDKFVEFLSKAPSKFQDKVLNFMVKLGDDAFKAVNCSEKFLGWVQKICSTKPVKILTKFANTGLGKVALSPWTAFVADGVVSSVSSYMDPSGEAYHDVGKAAVGGVIDAVSGVGPIEGALLGASGGFIGVGFGFIAGSVIWGTQLIWPDWPDKAKGLANNAIDAAREKGKAAKQKISNVTETMSNSISEKGKAFVHSVDSVGQKANVVLAKIPKTTIPQLSWF